MCLCWHTLCTASFLCFHYIMSIQKVTPQCPILVYHFNTTSATPPTPSITISFYFRTFFWFSFFWKRASLYKGQVILLGQLPGVSSSPGEGWQGPFSFTVRLLPRHLSASADFGTGRRSGSGRYFVVENRLLPFGCAGCFRRPLDGVTG